MVRKVTGLLFKRTRYLTGSSGAGRVYLPSDRVQLMKVLGGATTVYVHARVYDRGASSPSLTFVAAQGSIGDEGPLDYEPSVSASPRRALIQRALELICQFPEAIPENFQGWRVRANVRDPILDGEMTYWLYGREDRWTGLVVLFADALEGVAEVFEDLADLWDAVSGLVSGEHTVREFVALLLDVGISTIDDLFDGDILSGLRGLADAWWNLVADMSTTGLGDWIAAEFVIGPSHCKGAYFVVDSTPDMRAKSVPGMSEIPGCCPTARQAVDLRGQIAFGFTETDGLKSIDWGANHAFLVPSLQHVWLCAVSVDRAAIMYDWFYQLAVRLYAYAQSEGRDTEEEYDRYMLSAQYALRMALSLAARAATWVLHETAHNVSLYHCSENEVGIGETPVYCLQDATARMWWAHVTARLGLPGVETGSRPKPVTMLHFWSVYWTEDLVLKRIGPRFQDKLECQSELKIDARAALDVLARVVGAVAFAEAGIAVVAALAGRPSVVRHAGAAILWMEVSDALAAASDLELRSVKGHIRFGIVRPLTVGSRVAQCCIATTDSAPCPQGGANISCWEQPPDPNTAGCCS